MVLATALGGPVIDLMARSSEKTCRVGIPEVIGTILLGGSRMSPAPNRAQRFIREFREVIGLSPGAYLAQSLPDGGGLGEA